MRPMPCAKFQVQGWYHLRVQIRFIHWTQNKSWWWYISRTPFILSLSIFLFLSLCLSDYNKWQSDASAIKCKTVKVGAAVGARDGDKGKGKDAVVDIRDAVVGAGEKGKEKGAL